MEAIRKTQTTSSNQQVVPQPGDASQAPEKGTSSEFDKTLRLLVGSERANQVSEEDLFAALVQERIKNLKGEEHLKEFQSVLQSSQQSLKKHDGFIPMEDATKAALMQFRTAGKLTSEETDSIYSQAFAAAQLDSDVNALFDSKGGKGDTSIAVASLEQALLSSRVSINEYDSGKKTAPKRSVEEASNGRPISAGGVATTSSDSGFLFKPISDSDGKLAILLPPRLTGLAQGVRLMSPSGELLETGRYSGNGNGDREHFRFTKPGGGYPDGLTVEVLIKGGEIVRYTIDETSERNEGGTYSERAQSSSSQGDRAESSSASNRRRSDTRQDREGAQDTSL